MVKKTINTWLFVEVLAVYLYDDYKIKPLHIMLPKTSVYVKRYDGQTKWMYFSIEDNNLEK